MYDTPIPSVKTLKLSFRLKGSGNVTSGICYVRQCVLYEKSISRKSFIRGQRTGEIYLPNTFKIGIPGSSLIDCPPRLFRGEKGRFEYTLRKLVRPAPNTRFLVSPLSSTDQEQYGAIRKQPIECTISLKRDGTSYVNMREDSRWSTTNPDESIVCLTVNYGRY